MMLRAPPSRVASDTSSVPDSLHMDRNLDPDALHIAPQWFRERYTMVRPTQVHHGPRLPRSAEFHVPPVTSKPGCSLEGAGVTEVASASNSYRYLSRSVASQPVAFLGVPVRIGSGAKVFYFRGERGVGLSFGGAALRSFGAGGGHGGGFF
ncbi:hypothetical protein Syun_014007 [Stephania yunnanensis]|uniref:Uncharacterized protein n=1 Tax=Stephania yunnanensis TaxID=152371 RepID=A0AAP0P8C6_9MAGN